MAKIKIDYKIFTKNEKTGLLTQVINTRYLHGAITKFKNSGEPGVYKENEDYYFEPNVVFKDSLKIIGPHYEETVEVKSNTDGRTYFMEYSTFVEMAKIGKINHGNIDGEFFMRKKSDKFRLVSSDLYELDT